MHLPINAVQSGQVTALTVTVSGVPSGVTLYGGSTWTIPASEAGSNTENLYLAASSSAAPGTLTVTGDNGTVTHTYAVPVTIGTPTPFQIHVSPSALTLAPGGSGTVQVTVTGSNLPANLEISPYTVPDNWIFSRPDVSGSGSGPFTLTFTAPMAISPVTVPVYIGVYDPSQAAGNGSESAAPVSISVNQPFPMVTALTRANFVRDNDTPWSITYDQARKLLFVAYPNLNEIRVYSSIDQHVVGTIPVLLYPTGNAAPTGDFMDESADESRLYVGSLGRVVTIDPNLLQVVATTVLPSVSPAGQALPLGAVHLVTLADGKLLLLNFDGHLYLWDPATGSITGIAPAGPVQNFERFSRSSDHTTVLLSGGAYGTGAAVFFFSGSDTFGTVVSGLLLGQLTLSPDGTKIASLCIEDQSLTSSLVLLDNNFQVLATQPSSASPNCGFADPARAIFSLDGRTIYAFPVVEGEGNVGAAWDAQTLAPLGLFSLFENYGLAITYPLAIDESGLIFGAGTGPDTLGLPIEDASHPGAILPDPAFEDGLPGTTGFIAPGVIFPYAVNGTPAPLRGMNPAVLNGMGFETDATYGVFVGVPPGATGSAPASGVSLASSDQLTFTMPPGVSYGPANVTLTRADGWHQVIPDGVSYGPWLLGADPNAISSTVPTVVTLYGYGLTTGTATFDGQEVALTSGSAFPNGAVADIPPFPLVYAQITVPPGTPGTGDVAVAAGTGTTTLHLGAQFLKTSQVFPLAGQLTAIVYDHAHQRVFVSNTNNNSVAVFDLASETFLAPIAVGNMPTSLALTPDQSLLAVLNASDGTVSVLDLSQLKVVAAWPAITAAEKAVSLQPDLPDAIAPVSLDRVAVHIPGASYVHLLNLQSGSLGCTGVAGCDTSGTGLAPGFRPLVLTSTPDGTKMFWTDEYSHAGVLDLGANTLTSAVAIPAPEQLGAVANADGTVFVDNMNAYDGQLNPINTLGGDAFYYNTGNDDEMAGEALNPSGSLLFRWGKRFDDLSDELHVFDVRHARLVLRIATPDARAPASPQSIAIDETGTRLFFLTRSGISLVQLGAAPLSLASVAPGAGSPGSAVVLRGSGFSTGTTVSFGSLPAQAAFVDGMTLKATVPALPSGPVRVTVTNPDGASYSLDAAFTAN